MLRNYPGLSFTNPLDSTHIGSIIKVWTLLSLIVFASSATAGIGFQISPSIALDTADPQLVVDQLDEHTTFFTEDIIPFHWTSFDHNPGTTTDHFQASLIIEETPVQTISWYPDIAEFIWNCTMPAVQSGNCVVEVIAIDSFGNITTGQTNKFSILLSTSAVPEAPTTLSLGAPAPNPFNPATTVSFSAPPGSKISLSVYDARGRLVRQLAEGTSGSAIINARWDGMDNAGRPQPGGVYVFVLDAQTAEGSRRLTRKAMLIP